MTQGVTIQEAAALNQRYVKICGAVQAGKTETLVQRCLTLLGQGADASRILMTASNASAAQVLRERLLRAAEGSKHADLAGQVKVASVRKALLDVLGAPEAQQAAGRVARVLNDAEMLFLLEDLKARGIEAGTLRGALALFARNWEEMLAEEEWGLDDAQAAAHARLIDTLKARGCMMPQEVAHRAATFLSQRPQAAFDYVLCDDFQNLSRAEQTCMGLLASTQLAVAGNAQQTVAVHSKHPCATGFARFEDGHEGTQVVALANPRANTAIGRFAQALTGFGDMPSWAFREDEGDQQPDAASAGVASGLVADIPAHLQQGVVSVKWNTPDDEELGLFKYLQALKKAGAIEEDRDVAVVVPNARWARMAQKALARRGFATNMLGMKVRIGGDPRDADRCPALVAYTKLNLLVHPDDVVAWRSWCGIGEAHLNSASWAALEDYAAGQGVDVLQALESLGALDDAGTEPFEGACALGARYREGCALVADLQKRKGFAILNSIGADKLPEFANTYQTLAGDEDAAFVFGLQREALFDPELPEKLNAVRIVEASSMCGLSAPVVVVAGTVDGFFPSHAAFDDNASESARTARLDSERRVFYSAVGKARKLLVMSFFAKADKQLAEAGRMHIARCKKEHGQDIALLRQSTFLAEGDSQLAGTVGGQQLLAALE